MNKILFLVISILSTVAYASADAHAAVEIPLSLVLWQLFNVVVAAFIIKVFLTYVMKFSLREMFKARRENFTQLMENAEAAKLKAEETHKELKEKLTALSTEAESNTEQARQEALELKNKILIEAQQISDRMIKDAQLTSEFELEKAKLNLRSYLLDQSISTAQSNIKEQASEEELNKLQHNFVDKIQVVQ